MTNDQEVKFSTCCMFRMHLFMNCMYNVYVELQLTKGTRHSDKRCEFDEMLKNVSLQLGTLFSLTTLFNTEIFIHIYLHIIFTLHKYYLL